MDTKSIIHNQTTLVKSYCFQGILTVQVREEIYQTTMNGNRGMRFVSQAQNAALKHICCELHVPASFRRH